MVARDAQAVAEIEAVRVLALGTDTRVQVQLPTALLAGGLLEPGEQGARVALAAHGLAGHEVIDVELPAGDEPLGDPETGNRGGLPILLDEGADQPIAVRPLTGDARRQGVFVEVRTQLQKSQTRQV